MKPEENLTPAVGDKCVADVSASTIDASTADAVRAVLEHPFIVELQKHNASKELIALLEPMEGSKTGLGLRRQDGVLFEIVRKLKYGYIQCKRTVVTRGTSLPIQIEFDIDFQISVHSNPTSENLLCAEKETWEYAQYICYTALGSNPHLEGCLIVEGSSVFYKWRGKDEGRLQVLIDDTAFKIFFDTNTNSSALQKITRKFNPATVTSMELDRAIAKSRGVDLLPAEESSSYIPAKMPEIREVIANPIDEIITNSLDEPKFAKAANGTIAYGSDKGIGYKDWNEDNVVVNTGDGNGFAVIDGMGGEGGEGCGEMASQIFAETFQKGLRENASFEDIQKTAHERMAHEGLGRGGVCYIGFNIDGRKLEVAQAGDVKLIVLDRNGVIKFKTTNEVYGGAINNAVMGIGKGETTRSTADLEVGDRIVVASDGLFDNLSSQEVADFVRGKTIQEAIFLLNIKAKDKMANFKTYREQRISAKPDNISVFIYDIEKLS